MKDSSFGIDIVCNVGNSPPSLQTLEEPAYYLMCFPVSAGKWKLSRGEVRWGFVNEKVCGRFHMDSQLDREQWKCRWMAMAAGAVLLLMWWRVSLLASNAVNESYLFRFALCSLHVWIFLLLLVLFTSVCTRCEYFSSCYYCLQCCMTLRKVATSLKENVPTIQLIYQIWNYLSIYCIKIITQYRERTQAF